MELTDIPLRLRAMRRSQADLARVLQLDPSSLVKTIKGKRRVQAAEIAAIETFFGERLDLVAAHQAPTAPRRRVIPNKIPLYGFAAAGGGDRIAYADDRVLDWIEPPPFWNGTGDLIYVRLVGESMEPRYFSGEIVPVRLNLPPGKGQDCLIEFSDGSAVIKTYEGQRDGKVYAKQYNEPKIVPFEGAHVRALHTVWKPGLI